MKFGFIFQNSIYLKKLVRSVFRGILIKFINNYYCTIYDQLSFITKIILDNITIKTFL